MGLNRNISLAAALRYRGQGPYWAYIMHRIGGSALFIFLTIYILALVGVQAANSILGNWIFQLIFLPFMLFHAINGLRITILDLWPKLMEHYRQVIQIEWVVYALVCVFALIVVIRNAFGG